MSKKKKIFNEYKQHIYPLYILIYFLDSLNVFTIKYHLKKAVVNFCLIFLCINIVYYVFYAIHLYNFRKCQHCLFYQFACNMFLNQD